MLWRLFALSLLVGCVHAPVHPGSAKPVDPERAPVLGLANIQRSMRLLASSSPAQPNRVRILFYGQSITQSSWSAKVASDLHAKYPHAQLEIQNRALGGFSSERLLQTADADLYPWQPDLVIFHVYGAQQPYEQLIERIRARTSADVLVQTDHITRDEELQESLEARDNPPDAAHWSGFMNQAFLPSLVARYQVTLCDVRASWKAALRKERLHASAWLLDAVHPNTLGDMRMTTLVESCLLHDPQLRSPAEDWVETVQPAPRVAFHGQRVDIVVAPGKGVSHVRIDGAAPSTLGLTTFARAHVRGGDKWPPVHGVAHNTPLVPETFTFALKREGEAFYFALRGSVTGDDGEGITSAPFVSPSGRVVLEPSDWDIAYAFEMMGRPVPDELEIELRVESHAIDGFVAYADEERTLTVASGLKPGAHLLEIEGDAPLRAVTLYRAATDL